MPGGKIGVFTGLLRVTANDDQLAAVIAHEVAHALARHTRERLERELEFGGGLSGLSFNREQESEADRIGIFLMTFAGYRPEEAIGFWIKETMKAGSPGEGAIVGLIRSVIAPESLGAWPGSITASRHKET